MRIVSLHHLMKHDYNDSTGHTVSEIFAFQKLLGTEIPKPTG